MCCGNGKHGFVIFCMLPPSFLAAECTAEEAFSILGDNIIFASGSPFSNVDLGISLQIPSRLIFVY